jgi:PEGA domain
MIHNLKRVALILVATSSLSACATVTRGSNDAWVVDSNPSGASVTTSNGYSCDSTPCAIRMSRKSEFTAEISKPGYKTVTVSVSHKTANSGAAGVAGNVLVGGLIGIGVDMVSGASQDLVPNPVKVNLEPER